MKKILLASLSFALCLAFTSVSLGQNVTACRVDFDKDGTVTTNDFLSLAECGLHVELNSLLDLDGNGEVNGDDGAIFGSLLGETHTLGDFNGTGTVTGNDFTFLLGNYEKFNPCFDLNGDGFVYKGDIDIFIDDLFGN